MKKLVYITLYISMLFLPALEANNKIGKKLASDLNLIPGKKASIQWKRIFKNPKKLKQYKLDKLSKNELNALEKFLIEHSADSPKPLVPGLEK